MKIIPTEQWLKLYEAKKHLLKPDGDLNGYFTAEEIAGNKLDRIFLGNMAIPTGEFLVRDPIAHLGNAASNIAYLQNIPVGTFPVTACVVIPKETPMRYVAVKVDFSADVPVRYEEALSGIEDLENLTEGQYFGFNVRNGLAAIVDKKVAEAYCEFFCKWAKENPNSNIYDNYFAAFFAQSYWESPKYQHPSGSYINWTIPGTDYQVQMFASGFGNGSYPVYFGYNYEGQLCRLVIQFIDIEIAYGQELKVSLN